MLEVMIALDKGALCSSRKHGEGRSSYEIKHVFYGQSFCESEWPDHTSSNPKARLGPDLQSAFTRYIA